MITTYWYFPAWYHIYHISYEIIFIFGWMEMHFAVIQSLWKCCNAMSTISNHFKTRLGDLVTIVNTAMQCQLMSPIAQCAHVLCEHICNVMSIFFMSAWIIMPIELMMISTSKNPIFGGNFSTHIYLFDPNFTLNQQ